MDQPCYQLPLLHRTAEELRLRLRTLAICQVYLKITEPSRRVLQSITVAKYDRYTDWLFGPEVWGQVSPDAQGRPLSSPTIDHVLVYDFAIREKATAAMNSGTDFATALAEAQENSNLRQLMFSTPVAIHAASPASRSVTAPGLAAAAAPKKRGRDTDDDNNPGPSNKKARNRANKQSAKIAELQKQLAAARSGNGGNPNGRNPNGRNPNGKGDGKGSKGGGKGGKDNNGGRPAGSVSETTAGEPICWNWNRPHGCRNQSCTRKHVCWFCQKADHNGCNHRNNA